MKKIPLIITLLLFISISNISNAGVIFVPVGGRLKLDGFGRSQIERTIINDKVIFKIKTQGLSTVDNLQGFTATDDLWLIIKLPKNASADNPGIVEIIGGEAKGRGRGQIDGLLEQPLKLKSRIKGEAFCTGQGENPCTTLAVVLDMKGVLFFAPVKPAELIVEHAGSIDIKVMATFFTGEGSEPPSWKEWTYSGEIGWLESSTQ